MSAGVRAALSGLIASTPDPNSRRQHVGALAVEIVRDARAATTAEEAAEILRGLPVLLEILGQTEEALCVGHQVLDILGRSPISGRRPTPLEEGSIANLTQLCKFMADVAARCRDVNEALFWAEQSKARRLRAELEALAAKSNELVGALQPTSWAELQALLAFERAAVALFCGGDTDTLLFVLDPASAAPRVISLEALGATALQQLLSNIWQHPDALGSIARVVLPHFESLVRSCEVLYLVPDPLLAQVPFAALRFSDGDYLGDVCALATIPSLAVWRWCRARHHGLAPRDFVVAGWGSAPFRRDNQQREISFVSQARDLAKQLGADATLLEKPTAKRLLQAALRTSVVHVSCHGGFDDSVYDTLAASQLALAHGNLTAADVFELNGELNAELVFLNACSSGRYRAWGAADVGGFWEAVLHAGASSLITTLVPAHPEPAHEVARRFYQEWLGQGVTKAEALRRAQCQVRKLSAEYRQPAMWASHLLVGYHR